MKFKEGQKSYDRNYTEKTKMANKHMKNFSTLAIRDWKLKR